MDNYSHSPHSNRIGSLLRAAFVIAAALLSAGGALGSQIWSDLRSIGHALTLAGYIVFAVELVTLTAMQLYFWKRRSGFLQSSHKVGKRWAFSGAFCSANETGVTDVMPQVLTGSLIGSPFILVRTIYGILEVVFQNNHSTTWNPVYGSAVAFALMALLMEYVALCVYLYTGYSIAPGRGLAVSSNTGSTGKA